MDTDIKIQMVLHGLEMHIIFRVVLTSARTQIDILEQGVNQAKTEKQVTDVNLLMKYPYTSERSVKCKLCPLEDNLSHQKVK